VFRSILVANRAEIAVRIIRTLRDLGIRSVAVYSEADRDSHHVASADEAYLLGPPPPAESYLRIDKILEAARSSGAEAVHPGYGFLAENQSFAQAVDDAGLVWVGPPPEAMAAMGDKVAARNTAIAAGVPVIAGTEKPVNKSQAKAFARKHGYPIAVKAVMGGGGKAFRVARSADELDDALEGAAREAQAYFGDSSVFLERYVDHPRHVEAQILADSLGGVAFLGERDCSTQRRHQKLLEEAPSPAVTPEIRERIGQAAVSLAKSVGYRSAGTVEFLLSPSGELSFLEMNTRLQVEHPVTELVCGVDLVAEQIRVAAGEPVGYDALPIRGHAIECRINAENPGRGFMPSPGLITAWDDPQGPWVRVDAGFGAGREIPRDYDSLIAKLICFGTTREQARRRTLRALEDFRVEGVSTTIDFHRAFLDHPTFVQGGVWTRFVEDVFLGELSSRLESLPAVRARGPAPVAGTVSTRRLLQVEVDGKRFEVTVSAAGIKSASRFEKKTGVHHGAEGGPGEVHAPMQGTIVKVMVEVGQDVAVGDLICTLEAMKMENHILSTRDGKVAELLVSDGSKVDTGALLARIE
jgi:acetyl-CoA/propionyl-CoA carboxylase biotin carboxyl carrier protein